jgi:hypothetical protein
MLEKNLAVYEETFQLRFAKVGLPPSNTKAVSIFQKGNFQKALKVYERALAICWRNLETTRSM